MEPLITKEESRDKMNAITCRIHNDFNCYYGNVFQSNNDSTQKNMTGLLSKQCKKVYVTLYSAPTK